MSLAVGTQLAWGGRDGIGVGWGGGRDAASRRSPPRFTIRVGRGNGTAKKDKTKRKRQKKTLDMGNTVDDKRDEYDEDYMRIMRVT